MFNLKKIFFKMAFVSILQTRAWLIKEPSTTYLPSKNITTCCYVLKYFICEFD
jgi:hypothetical protein